MRRLFPLLLLVAAGIPSSGDAPRPRLGTEADIRATPVALFPGEPQRRTIDALTYLGGVRLTSRDPAFGGFSSMTVVGDRFTLVSDAGNVVAFRMGADMKPFDPSFADLSDGSGYGWAKGSRDSESMTRDPATGRIWIGFENSNSIWRFDPALTRVEARRKPRPMRGWDVNGGPEAMVRLRSGAFVVLSEKSKAPGIEGRAGIWFDGDPAGPTIRGFRFGYRPPPGGFEPSDMAELPDGRVLILVRRVSLARWFEAKLVLIDPRAIRPGKSIAGKEIAAFTVPATRDNFEALAVTQEAGATILWIASDDNRLILQRTLLMKFRLDHPRTN
jgi:hypothetical protein